MCGLAEFSIPQESLGSQIANPQITNPQIANPQSATFVEDPQIYSQDATGFPLYYAISIQ
jgi:hypothetical protein